MDKDFSVVGKSVARIDAMDKVTGRATYASDLAFPGMLDAKLLRSPHAHARVIRIEASKAMRLPGVHAIATILEVPKVMHYWFFLRTREKQARMFLLDQTVRFIGDPVAAIAADDEEIAEEAIGLMEVEYEPLEPLFSPFDSMKSDAVPIHKGGNILFQVTKHFGNIEKGFQESDLIVENRYHTSKQKHTPLEPIGTCVAEYNPACGLTVYSSTQLPHWSQMYISNALSLPLNKVRIQKPYTGGAFGGRCGLIHGLEVMTSSLSMKTLRPVKMSFTREEELIGTESRHPMTIDIKTGAKKDGTLVANRIRIVADVGAYGTHYIGVIANCLSTGVGLYRIPHVDFNAKAVYTNTSLCGAFRGYGNPQMNFAQESQVDQIAHQLGMDPLELRLKNYRKKGEIDPVFNEVIRSNGLEECLEKGSKAFGWNQRGKKPCPPGQKRGAGLAVMLHGTGAARALPDPASATLMINADGSASLLTAAADDGQGNRTVLAQIASEVLGITMDRIFVSFPDTLLTPLDGGTHGSRQTYCGGLAVRKASEKARSRLLQYAAEELKTDASGLSIRENIIFRKDKPELSVPVSDLMRKRQIGDMSLCSQIVETYSGVAPAMPGYYGANFAEVEVDTQTGHVEVRRLSSALDVGKAINPALVEGQITGGGVMGIGWALTEDLIMREGRVLNADLRDYLLLRAPDVPRLDVIIVESQEPTGPFGAKGVGEGAMVSVASSIANAVHDAIGVRFFELPITAEKVLRALEGRRSEHQSVNPKDGKKS